ncbi:MAG: hypothetical protein V1837_03525 [Candidatus Woesearchaeota archaeon]
MEISDNDLDFLRETARPWKHYLQYYKEYIQLAQGLEEIDVDPHYFNRAERRKRIMIEFLNRFRIDDFTGDLRSLRKSLKSGILVGWKKKKLLKGIDRWAVIGIVQESMLDLRWLVHLRDSNFNEGKPLELRLRISSRDCQEFLNILTKNYEVLEHMIQIEDSRIAFWNSVKSECARKRLNIFGQALSVHATSYNWTVREIMRFRRIGLMSPNEIGRVGKGSWAGSHFPSCISLCFNESGYQRYEKGRVNFIIDPSFVRGSNQFFYIGDKPDDKGRQVLAQAGIGIEQGTRFCRDYGPNPGFHNEVLSLMPIPFEAIIGIVIEPEHLADISPFLLKFAERDYKNAIPVYDFDGNMIWPV